MAKVLPHVPVNVDALRNRLTEFSKFGFICVNGFIKMVKCEAGLCYEHRHLSKVRVTIIQIQYDRILPQIGC